MNIEPFYNEFKKNYKKVIHIKNRKLKISTTIGLSY